MQYLHWHLIGTFVTDRDDRILVEPKAEVNDRLVSQPLLGLVISLVLERRKLLCLHASAVNVAGRAVVLLGDKWAGKSTTSPAMQKSGHLPITDDLIVIDDSTTKSLAVRPGFSCM